jgi:putative nucleotidyltransferase with HDIG domain
MRTETIRQDLLTRAKTLKVLPTLSTVVDRLFEILNDRNASFSELVDIVRYDQAISSKIISIANSAYYSRGIKIMSLQRAMIMVGMEELKYIVTCLVFLEGILRKLRLRDEDLVTLWSHSVYVACAARVLSTNTLVEEPEKVFTLALVHDIGKVLMYMYLDDYRHLINGCNGNGKQKDLCAEERSRFGIDHQEIGYYMSMKWRFPSEFGKVIRYHHDNKCVGESEVLLNLIRTADTFADFPDADLGMEGFILLREKERIDREAERIKMLLGSAYEKK